jgi:NADH:ubiquinone oxidoreductase subunit 4 (subunit M)
VALYSASSARAGSAQPVVPASNFVLAVLTALLIWFGVYPAPLLDMIQRYAVLPVVELLTPGSDKLSQQHQLRRSELPANYQNYFRTSHTLYYG